jgi:hypothetical protein
MRLDLERVDSRRFEQLVAQGGEGSSPPATHGGRWRRSRRGSDCGAAMGERRIPRDQSDVRPGRVRRAIACAKISEDSRVPAVATESIENATDVANRLNGDACAVLVNDAAASFDVAARWGLAVCMAGLLLGALSAAVGLSRASPAE